MSALASLLAVDDGGLAGSVADWGFVGGAAALLAWLLRRWTKQQDDAFKASETTEARVSAAYEKRLTDVKADYEARIAVERVERRETEQLLVADAERMRSVLRRVVNALDNPVLRDEVLTMLFPDRRPE